MRLHILSNAVVDEFKLKSRNKAVERRLFCFQALSPLLTGVKIEATDFSPDSRRKDSSLLPVN